MHLQDLEIPKKPAPVLDVKISPDGLLALLDIKYEEGAAPVTIDDLQLALTTAGVTHGILEDVLNEVVAKGGEQSDVLIAQGTPAVNGEDGGVDFTFDAKLERVGPRIGQFGEAKLKDLGLFENVKKGDLLVTKKPATPGTDGIDVRGKVIRAVRGKDVACKGGKNTMPGADPDTVVATTDGQPKFEKGQVYVEEVLNIRSDVDFGTGNIDFIGSVVVHGFVQNGFSIKAGGDVTCLDVVEGASIEAAGNIILKWGFKGQNKGSIKAGGDVRAKFLESCTVESKKSVVVADEILNSFVDAADTIECLSGLGTISGGRISAGKKVICKILGSEMGTKTIVEVGAVGLKNEYQQLRARLDELVPKMDLMAKTYRQLENLKLKGALTPQKQEMMDRLLETFTVMQQEYKTGKARFTELGELLKDNTGGFIKVTHISHPDVEVTIGKYSRKMTEPLQGVVYRSEGGEIVMTAVSI